MRIWEFISYRDYLHERLGAEGSRTGQRKALAAAIPVHTTFVSQVLKGRAEFSLEQGEAINGFLGHTDEEGEYFLLMLMHERASSTKLKVRFRRQIESKREGRLNIEKRLNPNQTISAADREKFYSNYIYSAVHVLVSIPKFQRMEALAEALRLPMKQIVEVVDFLIRIGVLKESNAALKPTSNHIHIGQDSDLVLRHHANWRFHSLQSLQFLDREDLHYSACLSLSQEDAFHIKESLLENLKSHVDKVSRSKEEVAYVMNLDFYKLLVG